MKKLITLTAILMSTSVFADAEINKARGVGPSTAEPTKAVEPIPSDALPLVHEEQIVPESYRECVYSDGDITVNRDGTDTCLSYITKKEARNNTTAKAEALMIKEENRGS